MLVALGNCWDILGLVFFLYLCVLQLAQALSVCFTHFSSPIPTARGNSCPAGWSLGLDGPNRQSPIASVQRTRSTLAGHSEVPRGTNTVAAAMITELILANGAAPYRSAKPPTPQKCSGECSERCRPESGCSGKCSEIPTDLSL